MTTEALLTRSNRIKRNTSLTAPFSEGLLEYTGIWETAQVVHLLKRTLFGAKPQDIAYFKTRTMQEAVDELFSPLRFKIHT